MKGLAFTVLAIILIVSSMAVAASIPLTNPQSAAAEEPEPGIIVLNQNTEVVLTNTFSGPYTNAVGETVIPSGTVYEYTATIESAPIYMPDLVTKIDPQFYWDSENGKWHAGVNIFNLSVRRTIATTGKDGEEMIWNPTVLLNNTPVPVIGDAVLLETDPENENYHNNTIEWDYGICVRRIRIIEGALSETYVFDTDPNGDIQIQSNTLKTGNFSWDNKPFAYDANRNPLNISDDKLVNASEFHGAAYPVTVDPTFPYYSTDYNGFIESYHPTSYESAHADDGTGNLGAEITLHINTKHGGSENYMWASAGQDMSNYIGTDGQTYSDYQIMRGFLYFNTQELPQDITITGAWIYLYGIEGPQLSSADLFVLSAQNDKEQPEYPHIPLRASDFNRVPYIGAEQTPFGSIGASSWCTTDYCSIRMRGSYDLIHPGDITKFCLMSNADRLSQPPTFGNGDQFDYWDYMKGDGYWPYLKIKYTQDTPPTPTPTPTSTPSPCPTTTKPVLYSPIDGETTDTTPDLDWSASGDVEYYDLYLGTNENYLSLYAAYILSSEYSVTKPLSYNTPYYWKIEAVNDCGSITSSSIQHFITESAATTPTPAPTPTPTPTATPWSFAIITDLHVGESDSDNDFGYPGWNDNGSYGSNEDIQNQQLQNLMSSVQKINARVNTDKIKFVAVLGDITSSAELSEMQAAIDILNTLSVPWLPIIGNHDIWPYTGDTEAPYPITNGDGPDIYFNDYFNSNMWNDVYQNFADDLGLPSSWKEPIPILNTETSPNFYSYFQNFEFEYGGFHFIGLDFNTRNHAPFIPWPGNRNPGVGPEGDLHSFEGGTWNWFTQHLYNYVNSTDNGKNVIILSHHPFEGPYTGTYWPVGDIEEEMMGFSAGEKDTIAQTLWFYKDYLAIQFSGHHHPGDSGHFLGQDYILSDRMAITKWVIFRQPYSPQVNFVMPCVTIPGNLNVPWVQIVKLDPNDKTNINHDEDLFHAVTYRADCPVDMVVTDPDGLVISKDVNQIPGAMYITKEYDINGNSSSCNVVWIPDRKLGNYSIQVIPWSTANNTDTFTLTASPTEDKWGYTPITLAQNISMEEIPADLYIFEVKERTATNLSYTGALSGFKSDTVNLTATLSTENGSRLSGKTINFTIGNQSVSAVTDYNGIATASLTLNQIPCQYYYIEYGFDGDTDYLPYYDSQLFEIINRLPVSNIGGPYISNEGSQIELDGSSSYDPDGTIVSYEWDLNEDGNFSDAQGTVVQHTWPDDYSGNIGLRVTDDCGATSTAATTVAINNVAPTVSAGPDIESVLVGSTISFNGSFTDPGVLDTHTIEWNFGDGTPTVTETLTPTHAFTSSGSYTVTLTVTDDDRGIGINTLTVHVNHPPVTDTGGPYTGNEGSAITFNGSMSHDPDGIITAYSWNFGDGTATVTGTAPSHTYGDNGTYTVTLTVTDNNGAIGTAATTATIANVAPVVNAGPDMEDVPIGSTINFNSSFTDPGWLDTHTIAWDFGDGTPVVTGTLTPTHTYASGGDYTVTLTVTDDDGGVGSDTLTVHVNDAPIADPGGPYTGDEGSAITFNGSASYDPDGSIVSYEWDLNGDGDFSDAQGAIIQNTWTDDYSGNIGLKVTDDEGTTGFATTTVTVNNVAPTVDAGPDQNAECCVTEVAFSGSFTDPGIPDTYTISWDFGDGAGDSGTLSPAHTYCDPGIYMVTLTVTDDDGGVGTDTMTVTVTDTISPEVSIASPEDGRIYINTQGPIAVTYTAVDICDQTPDVVITLDGNAIDGENIDPAVLALGGHTMTVTVTDSSGNVAAASVTFIIKPQLSAWGRTWGFLEWYGCGYPTSPADFFGSYSYPLVTADGSIYSRISADDSSYWRQTGYKSLPLPWEHSQLFVYTITQDRAGVSNLSITWTGHGDNGDLIYHTKLKIWNYQTGSWHTLVDVTSPGSKIFQTYDRGITTNATDFIEAGTGNVSILVSADDDGRGLTEDTEGIFTDYIALNVNAANTPASPSTTTYTFASGGGTNKWCWEGHVHMIDWNGGHPTTPADLANSYGYIEGGASVYSALSASDDSRWLSSISHDLGCCAFDRNCELFKFNIAESPSAISNIGLKWEGHGTIGETIYYTTLKIWNPSSGAWEQLHNQQNTTSDVTWIDNIVANCSNYIDATGNLYILACAQRSGLSWNCGIWTDYIEVTITNE